MQRHTSPLFLVAGGIWLMAAIGAFLPVPLAWGFHSLAFLPVAVRVLFLAAGAAAILALRSEALSQRIERSLARLADRPVPVLLVAVAAFSAMAVALRVAVPLLGDSFIAIKLYENRASGPPFLPNSHYPSAFFYFFTLMRAMDAFTFPRIMDAFLAGEIVLGAGYVVAVWYLAGALFEDRVVRSASFLLLLLLPTTQLFLGYVEIYAVSAVFLVLYLLASALFLRRAVPFYAVPGAFLFLVLAHYLNLLLVPSLLYLAAIAYRRDGPAALGTGAAATAAVALLLFSVSGVELASLLPASRHSPFLTVGAAQDLYQAYGLLSWLHGVDLANLALFTAPAAWALLALGLRKDSFTAQPAGVFLATAALPVVAFFSLAKFDLPMAQDWDIPAPHAVVLTLLGLTLFAARAGARAGRALLPLLAATALASFSFFALNASTRPSLDRAEALIDPRISSQDGTYQSTLHLVEYYLTQGDTARVNASFERFLRLYPADPRGFENYTLHLSQFGAGEDARIRGLFRRWMALDASGRPHARYADFCLDAGHREYKQGAIAEARALFEEALRYNPAMPEALNGLGVIARRSGDLDGAIAFYERAAAIDSVNAYAFINLGNLHDDRGAPERAIAYYRKAIAVQPRAAEAWFNMGVTYARMGDAARSLEAVRQAARLGHGDAQGYLRSKGERW